KDDRPRRRVLPENAVRDVVAPEVPAQFERVRAPVDGKIVNELVLAYIPPLRRAKTEEVQNRERRRVEIFQIVREQGQSVRPLWQLEERAVVTSRADKLIEYVGTERVRPVDLALILRLMAGRVEHGIDRIGIRRLIPAVGAVPEEQFVIVRQVVIHSR